MLKKQLIFLQAFLDCVIISAMYYAYLIRCSDGSLYAGFTNDLEKRVSAHNAGKGSKYTRGRLPVALVYFEAFETEHGARSREWHLKRLSRAEKLALVNANGRGE